jgi:hypothetical protein
LIKILARSHLNRKEGKSEEKDLDGMLGLAECNMSSVCNMFRHG